MYLLDIGNWSGTTCKKLNIYGCGSSTVLFIATDEIIVLFSRNYCHRRNFRASLSGSIAIGEKIVPFLESACINNLLSTVLLNLDEHKKQHHMPFLRSHLPKVFLRVSISGNPLIPGCILFRCGLPGCCHNTLIFHDSERRQPAALRILRLFL